MATNLDEIERVAKLDPTFLLGAVAVLDLIQRLRAAEAAKNEPEETKFGRAVMNRLLTMFPGETASDMDEAIACWYALAAGVEEGIVVAAGAAVRAAEVPQKPSALADELDLLGMALGLDEKSLEGDGRDPVRFTRNPAAVATIKRAATALREAEAEIATLSGKNAMLQRDLQAAKDLDAEMVRQRAGILEAGVRAEATIERVRALCDETDRDPEDVTDDWDPNMVHAVREFVIEVRSALAASASEAT